MDRNLLHRAGSIAPNAAGFNRQSRVKHGHLRSFLRSKSALIDVNRFSAFFIEKLFFSHTNNVSRPKAEQDRQQRRRDHPRQIFYNLPDGLEGDRSAD